MSSLCSFTFSLLGLLALTHAHSQVQMGCFCIEIINATCMQMTCKGNIIGRSCFPVHSQVLLANGSEVYMNELTYGDRLAFNQMHEISDPNLFQFHWHEQLGTNQLIEYLQFYLVADYQVSTHNQIKNPFFEITPHHRLYSYDDMNVPRPASEFRVGDMLWGRYGPVKIKAIHSVFYDSAYSPMSTQGSYFVNGILTSAYSGNIHPHYLHRAAKVIFWFQDFQKKWFRKDVLSIDNDDVE